MIDLQNDKLTVFNEIIFVLENNSVDIHKSKLIKSIPYKNIIAVTISLRRNFLMGIIYLLLSLLLARATKEYWDFENLNAKGSFHLLSGIVAVCFIICVIASFVYVKGNYLIKIKMYDETKYLIKTEYSNYKKGAYFVSLLKQKLNNTEQS